MKRKILLFSLGIVFAGGFAQANAQSAHAAHLMQQAVQSGNTGLATHAAHLMMSENSSNAHAAHLMISAAQTGNKGLATHAAHLISSSSSRDDSPGAAAAPQTRRGSRKAKGNAVLNADDYKCLVDYFNRMEDENIVQAIPNAESWEWMKANIPLFDCPQDNFREMYYYRWWSLRKHIKETPQGYGVTEFLIQRSYSDKYNLIACAIGHHTYEMRWLHNPEYLQQYLTLWYTGNEGGPMAKLNKFSSWTPDAVYNAWMVNGDAGFMQFMYPMLVADYAVWERDKGTEDGMFWQRDVEDGMEESASGARDRNIHNRRPTINSYMYANAAALSKMAGMFGNTDDQTRFAGKAASLKALIQKNLWNTEHEFFETQRPDGTSSDVREAIGYIPWYFNLPDNDRKYDAAWLQITDNRGFNAPYGLTTCERRSPLFRTRGCCNCEWDGAIWPFASAQTLTAMANFMNNYPGQTTAADSVYFMQMEKYVESQYHRGRPYIGEYLDEVTGYWLKGDQERSRYYNHSTFNDLMITGMMGLRPRPDNVLEVNPLVPQDKWDWFCLDNVAYKGRIVTIIWDKTGKKYGKGQGLTLLVDGKKVANSPNLARLTVEL